MLPRSLTCHTTIKVAGDDETFARSSYAAFTYGLSTALGWNHARPPRRSASNFATLPPIGFPNCASRACGYLLLTRRFGRPASLAHLSQGPSPASKVPIRGAENPVLNPSETESIGHNA